MLSVQHLSFGYIDRKLFKNLNFDVRKAECLHIKGRNGSGKSTLLGLLHGQWRPQSGRVLIHDKDVLAYESKELEALSPLLDQFPLLAGHSTVLENLLGLGSFEHTTFRYLLTSKVATLKNMERTYWQLAEEVGLSANPEQHVSELSFGQKRLLDLVRIFWPSDNILSKLLILDEPLSGVSKENKEKVLNALIKRKNMEWAMVVVEHQPLPSKLVDGVIQLEDYI